MGARSRFRKLLLVLGSTILLGIQCPPIMMDAFKTGVVSWVSGSFSGTSMTQFADFIIGTFTGGPTLGL